MYVGVHVIEGYVVQPYVMRRAVEANPALLLFFQAIMGALFGLLGLMVATPLLTVIQITVTTLWIERRLHKTPPSSEPSRGRAARRARPPSTDQLRGLRARRAVRDGCTRNLTVYCRAQGVEQNHPASGSSTAPARKSSSLVRAGMTVRHH